MSSALAEEYLVGAKNNIPWVGGNFQPRTVSGVWKRATDVWSPDFGIRATDEMEKIWAGG